MVTRVYFKKLAVITVSLPLMAFFFCVIWSLLYDFEPATFTHCQVANYLPSISAAIGSFSPQKYVWQICVAIHSPPRIFVAHLYKTYLNNLLFDNRLWRILSSVIYLLQLTEIYSLLGLTFVSSSENFELHKLCFVAFMISAMFNMLMLYLTIRHGSKLELSVLEKQSIKYKLAFGVTNITSFFLAVYFYIRHNRHCEPGMYTIFALFEYIVVVSNMAYHMTAYWDFNNQVINLSSCYIPFRDTFMLPYKDDKESFIVKIA